MLAHNLELTQLTFLATFLNDYSFAEGAYSFINTIAEFIHEDFLWRKKLGVAFEDEKWVN